VNHRARRRAVTRAGLAVITHHKPNIPGASGHYTRKIGGRGGWTGFRSLTHAALIQAALAIRDAYTPDHPAPGRRRLHCRTL